jgi:hypothetical protein
MPWVEAEFHANAAPDGVVSQNKRLTAPLSGILKKYKVKTTGGCQNRIHPTSLLVKRVSDPSDMIQINLNIADCTDYEQDVTPPFHVKGGQDYDITLVSKAFGSGELVSGSAGVYYTIWFEL